MSEPGVVRKTNAIGPKDRDEGIHLDTEDDVLLPGGIAMGRHEAILDEQTRREETEAELGILPEPPCGASHYTRAAAPSDGM